MSAIPHRVSRWTPAIFACAMVNLGLGLTLAVTGLAWPVAPAAAPASLAMVHLLTIGWLSLVVFGALFQFVPVITSSKLPSQSLPLLMLIGTETGLALMVAGFFTLGIGGWASVLLPAGGAAATGSLLLGTITLLPPLVANRPMPLSARFVLAGQVFLLLTVLLGLSFTLAMTVPATGPALAPLLVGGVPYHVLAGLGGWFTLTAIGVSYELLPMFMLAPHERGAIGTAVFWVGLGGFATAFIAGLTMAIWPESALAALEGPARVAVIVALGLYLFDVLRLYRSRRRRQIELHNRAAIVAFNTLGLAELIAVGATATGRLATLTPALMLLLLLGWLSGLALTQLYKIVAFLSWLSRFGNQLGRGPVPRVQDLVHEARARGVFVVYFAAVAVAAAAAAFDLRGVVRVALALALAAVALLAREYYRAWRGYYANARRDRHAPHPPTFPDRHGATR